MRNVRTNETEDQKAKRRKLDRIRHRLTRKCKAYNLIDGDIQNGMDIHQNDFDVFQKSLQWYECTICKKRQIHSMFDKKPCKDCHLFTVANDLDPQDVPSELSDLTFVEQQLIARIHPVVSLYKVKNVQFKYTGQIINFPQHIQELCDVLPHKVEELTGVLAIRCKNSDGFKDFFIRKKKVYDALVWLKENNPFYNDIYIDEERVRNLPEDDSVYNCVRGYDEDLVEEGNKLTDNDTTFYITDEDKEEDVDPISYKNIPDLSYVSQKEQLNVNDNILVWPSIGRIPINEFSSPGYITMSFPHLFCYGTCDYSNMKNKNINLQKYVEHLLLYKDGRFARDPRFRFFLLNSIMRWQALKLGNIFVQQNSFFNKMTVCQLKRYLKHNPGHVKEILFYSRRIKSTKAFWRSKCSELEDMVNQIGPPTIFFTLSSADYHWKDLYRLFGFEDATNLTYTEKSKLLSENPLIVTTFFKQRIQYFLKKTFSDYFEVDDHWYRTEFQSRGSSHVHGVAWLKNAPDIRHLDTKEEKENALNFFNRLISCTNPDISFRPNLIHPCSKNLSDIATLDDDLAELVNRVQRHTCSKNYCLKKKNRVVKDCRFGFPKDLQENPEIIEDENGQDIIFSRNDQFVNNYNPWVLQTWRSNMDFSPIVSERILYKYIAKYASKCEYNSTEYSDILNTLLDNNNFEDEHCKKVIRKLMVKTCAEHDYSAQEVIYLLMNFPLVNCSREFVIINLNNRNWKRIDNFSCEEHNPTFMDKYMLRPKIYESYSLSNFAKRCYYYKKKLVVRRREAIVRLFPRFRKIYYDYSDLQNACLFHVPWRSQDEFFCHEEELRQFLAEMNLELNNLDELEFEYSDSDSSEDEREDYKGKQKETGLSYLSRNRPHDNEAYTDKTRSKFNHKYGLQKYDYNIIHDLVKEIKNLKTGISNIKYDHTKLSTDQLDVFNFLKEMIGFVNENNTNFDKRIIIQGKAGCGKSYLVHCMKEYVLMELGYGSCVTLGPTGVSANNVGGCTIHSFFRLPTRQGSFKRLVGQELHKFQEKHPDLKVILIDEYSMVCCKLLAMIDQRCRELKDTNEPFGNLIIILVGDIYQLKGVGDKALYDTINQSNWISLAQLGKAAVFSFQKAFFLQEPQRYTDCAYTNFLDRLSLGNCNEEDCIMVNSRHVSRLREKEIKKFEHSVRVCCINEDVKSFNNDELRKLSTAIVQINAQNNSLTAFKCADTYASGLANVLYLALNCRVMLRQNLNVCAGLVNGCLGYVKEILFDQDCKPPMLPRFLVIKFDNVEGFQYLGNGIPIQPIHCTWNINNISCTRVQFPVSLSWACTVHKSQSLTLETCQLDLGEVDFELGLTYVGLSRVKNLESLLLLRPITLKHLNSVKLSRMYVERENFIDWLHTLN